MILVTGGTGYIGSHTVVALAHVGHELLILDNLGNSRVDVPFQRMAPALPYWRRLCSSLETSPIVARQSMWILRTSPERRRTWA